MLKNTKTNNIKMSSSCLTRGSSARAHNTKAYHASGCPIGSGMTGESGRSMIEMLGVLAIIGVLSVGGIAGYTTAMRSYKANEIVNSTSMLYMMGIASNAGTGDANLSYADVMGILPAECAGIDYSGSTKQITTKVQDQAVCYQVKNKLGSKVTDGDCSTKTDGSYTLTVTLGEASANNTPESYDCTSPNGQAGDRICRLSGYYYYFFECTQDMDALDVGDVVYLWDTASGVAYSDSQCSTVVDGE